MAIVLPFGTRLISLDLDHTAVAGDTLTSIVLHSRRETLQHLSVRGCKQVSLKYNIMPFLTLFSLQKSASDFQNSGPVRGLALRSLYTFRCRHHRRRPYTPASLLRKDSDSVHTHELIKICYDLGIWTDTAWCPTPGGRCLKRKDYSVGRGTPDARTEVWVIYDRLWRSGNRLGPAVYSESARSGSIRGQLWEDAESGYNGEPLGCEPQQGQGEGKARTAHLRQSHRRFVENITCQDCKVPIPERCEHCCIRMHCMGCRKTLCENCAFSRPLPPAKYPKSPKLDSDTGNETATEPYWWAPSQMRNPNLMMQEVVPSTSADNSNTPNSTVTPALKMQWCCLKPMSSNGGSITFVGPGMTGSPINHIHTAPLPPGQGYEDGELSRLRRSDNTSGSVVDCPVLPGSSPRLKHYQMLHWLLYGMGSGDQKPCPRSLCHDCWQTPGWRAACQSCKESFCFAHDLRGLSMRICGYKDLSTEKSFLEENSNFRRVLEASERSTIALNTAREKTKGTIREYLNVLSKLPELSQSFKEKHANLTDSFQRVGSNTSIINSEILLGEAASELKKKSHEDELLKMLDLIMSTPISNKGAEGTEPESNDSWQGCGSFLCPKYRSIGDQRPRCTAAAQQCALCEVHVCPDCLAQNPRCDCAYCKDHYSCPNCVKTLGSLCKKVEEEEEARRNIRIQEEQQAKWERQLKEANDMAELAREFLTQDILQSMPTVSESVRVTMLGEDLAR
ncbi:MAG: hypothetical protein ALECFALPRED_006585 [Alectoria fallacina]|uniref:Uncharacterized protein n=1 Tax=Alectoria fallacina TaxID=1903189 RepID=A0A8H3EU39_9LECA|nr:MAG: hypothetical protein ALECFALPRED_006585 [Alectoria fallacina]